jgi:flagellar basal body-associated protein FliL
MKKKGINWLLIIVVFWLFSMALVAYLVLNTSAMVSHANLARDCTKERCHITFDLINNTSEPQEARYSIRLQKAEHSEVITENGVTTGVKDAYKNKTLVKQEDTIILNPNEQKTISLSITTSERPSSVLLMVKDTDGKLGFSTQ